MVIWMLNISIGVAMLVVSAAAHTASHPTATIHLALAAMISIVFAVVAIRETRSLLESGAARSTIIACASRFVGMVWAWGALTIVATYATGIFTWPDWPAYMLALASGAVTSLFLSATFNEDAAAGREDATLHTIATYVVTAHVVGMAAVIAGLLFSGRMVRFLDPRNVDWAAMNVLMCGAVAIFAISLYAFQLTRQASEADSAGEAQA